MMLRTSNISAKSFFINATKKNNFLEGRRNLLLQIAESIAREYTKNEIVNINFICSDNSRESQLCQAWAFLAAHHYGLNIHSFSGGLEVSSFHRNTIKTLQKTGFSFQLEDFAHQNPKYSVSYSDSRNSIIVFSKLYDNSANKEPFIAITTSKKAEEHCPLISNAIQCYYLPLNELKSSDGTDEQEANYLAISEKVATEIGYIFAAVKEIIS